MDHIDPARVLVVEDDPVCLHLISELLDTEGYDVTIAMNGADGMALAKMSFDLILLDVSLPDFSGVAVLRAIKELHNKQHVPVVALTSSDHPEDINGMFHAGAIDYVLKPFNELVMKAKIRTFIDLKQKTEKLNQMAVQDPLTGTYNRHVFTERLTIEWRRMARYHKPLALLMIDLDDFKQINDTHGHPAGDACLSRVAETLMGYARRAGDMVVRFGGDEFLMLLPEVDLDHAIGLAEIILKTVNRHGTNPDPNLPSTPIGLSIGCASVIPSLDIEPESLLADADEQLYKSKTLGGKNCVSPGWENSNATPAAE